jgi:hypothetical protein
MHIHFLTKVFIFLPDSQSLIETSHPNLDQGPAMDEDRGRRWPWGWRRSRRGRKGGALGHGGEGRPL